MWGVAEGICQQQPVLLSPGGQPDGVAAKFRDLASHPRHSCERPGGERVRTRCSEILVKATEQGRLGKVKVINLNLSCYSADGCENGGRVTSSL